MNDKNSAQKDETTLEILRIINGLSMEDLKTTLNVARLLVHGSGFFEAMKAATPAGKEAPPREVTKQLVDERIGKEAAANG